MKTGMQLWGVREALSENYEQTIAKIAGFGLDGVELFGDHKSAAETKNILDKNKLLAPSHHFIFDQLENDLPACIERTKAVGGSVVVCAWSAATPERSWESITASLAKLAEQSQAAGIPLAYHNHDHEILQKVAGMPVLDYMAEQAPNLKFELDIAWLHAGGVKPAQYLERYANRIVLLHVKDMLPLNVQTERPWQTVELGKGEVDLKSALEAAKNTAATWLLAEQDDSPTPLESTERNLAWLKARN